MTRTGDGGLLRVVLVAALVLFGLPIVTGAVMLPLMGAHRVAAPGLMVAVALLVPLVVVLVAVGLGVSVLSRESGRDEAVEELRRAYARGDVSDEEFERRRERLRED